ncbi:MAG: hypothetical protein R3F50_07745 [Gammaproteobacteria bacterium]
MPNLKALHRLSLFLILSLLVNSSQALEIAVHNMHGHNESSMLAGAHDDPGRFEGRFKDHHNSDHNADNDLPHPGDEASRPDESRLRATDLSPARSAGGLTVDSTDYSLESTDDCLCAELCCISLAGFSFAATGHSHYPGISFEKRLPDHYQSISLDPLRPPPNH